ncbi:putative Expansin-A16 [Cocos nucifera]|uniref:Putative Expansin-A16 n=1 Tax=Cocos nucifera TaxID=13894 RepID=A0A8K0MUG3_COCNU|nr:putative Expansin-A16 [Cocos nucifera]
MGVELMSNNDMAIYEMEDGYLSDTEVFYSVIQVLDGVRMAPNLIAESDGDQYANLLSIVDPGKKMGPDEEALLVTALKALSGAVSKIDTVFHGSLLNNIFSMCIWNYGLDARNALLELITTLAAVPDKFLNGCLHMLVSNFLPPRRLRESISQPRWLARKKEVHSQLHLTLHYIAELVPLTPMKLKDVIDKRMPRFTDSKDVIVVFVECMLGLESDEIGEFLGNILLAKVVDLLIDMDVNISWEDILQEDHNKGIFDMELEEWEENTDSIAKDSIKDLEESNRVLNGNVFAEKLDSLMVIVCEYLKSCADGGHLLKAPNLIAESDGDQYANLLSIVDPGKKMGPDEEALLVTALKALSGAVSKIDTVFHGSLLNNIFSMCIWNYGLDARNALLELITTLAAVPDKFLNGCLHMLVSNFLPPRRLRESISQPRWLARKKEVHSQLHLTLHYIAELVPLTPMKLKDVIDKRMPRFTDSKDVIVVFVECMLGLESDEIGEFLGNILLAKVVDLLIDMDVNISWEDILQEDHNKGIFDMELEEWEENTDSIAKDSIKDLEESNRVLNGNVFAEKLDSLMVIVCEYLKSCADGGHLLKVFEMLTEIFRRTVMNAYKSKFAQFVMFYACSLDPEICGLKFAVLLTDIFVSKIESPVSRLVDWCFEYCQLHSIQEKIVKPEAHRIFYSGCQVCLPSIVQEFLRQAKAARLFNKSVPSLYDNLLESEFSKAFGGIERFDMFFPFDPYLLKESDRFMRPHFEFWSMVKTTYSNYNSEDEYQYEDLDAPDFADNVGSSDGGACGYGELDKSGYGKSSAGLSSALFDRGSACGACLELRCVDHILWCLKGSPSVVVTATDFCAPNYGLPGDYGGWCNYPREHFEMSEAAFIQIAKRKADIIPVQFRRVNCDRYGGMRFTVTGSSYFYQVLITNVGSVGEVIAVKVKGSRTGWIPMARNWGQNWQCNADLRGQPLSFEVTDSSGRTVTSYNVASSKWSFGQTFEGKQFLN